MMRTVEINTENDERAARALGIDLGEVNRVIIRL